MDQDVMALGTSVALATRHWKAEQKHPKGEMFVKGMLPGKARNNGNETRCNNGFRKDSSPIGKSTY